MLQCVRAPNRILLHRLFSLNLSSLRTRSLTVEVIRSYSSKWGSRKSTPTGSAPHKHSGYKAYAKPGKRILKGEASLMTSSTGIKPREYQTECVHSCLDSFMKGVNRVLVSLPTGSGKTLIFTLLLEEVPSPFPGATKTLILVNRELQITQVHKYISNCGSKLTVSVDQGKQNPDMDNDVIVASVQSLARDPTRLLKYNPKQFKCIITDEAHHATSPSYAKILHHFRVHEKNKSHILLAGFTATAWRHDGVGLNTVFDEIVFHRSFMDMIEKHWLCPLRFETVNTGTDLADVDEAGKDFQERKLSEKINTSKRNASVVNAYRAHCDSRRKATVVFAADVKHSVAITEEFEEQGYHARSITNHTNAKERARLLQDFRDGKFPILVNCGMMTEGADFPMIDAIIIARPTKSTVLMVQMLGRGVRLHSGKVDCLVLDMVDTVDRKAFSIVPVLFGLDPKVPSSIITSARVTRIRRDGRSFGKYMLMGITREDLTSAHSSPTMELQYIPTTFATEHEKDLNQDDLALHVPDSPVNGEQDVVVKEHPLSTGHGADENGVQADEWSDAPNGVGNVPAIPKDTEATEAVWYDTDGSSQVHIKENISESHDASFSWWPSIWDATDESRGRTALTAFFQDLKTKLGWSEMETTENRSDQVNGEILQDDPLDLIKESPLTNMRVLQVDDELFYVLVNEQQLKILYKNGHPPIKVVRKGQGDLVEPRRAAEKGKNQAKESRQESE